MKPTLLASLSAAMFVSACATLEREVFSSITVRGKTYETVHREYKPIDSDRSGDEFRVMKVRIDGHWHTCGANFGLACATTVERHLDRRTGAGDPGGGGYVAPI